MSQDEMTINGLQRYTLQHHVAVGYFGPNPKNLTLRSDTYEWTWKNVNKIGDYCRASHTVMP
jgi:hypothetical protein